MLNASALEGSFRQVTTEQLRERFTDLLPQGASTGEKIVAVEEALLGPIGQSLRGAMARWIVDEIVPIERLVPDSYAKWRLPVRDSMIFVVERLSAARLAPKLAEQLELPADISPERRLLYLIAKVPGLQKLGQVIARNQHLRPALRKALARLENGIRDVNPEKIRAILQRQLGQRLDTYQVEIAPTILSEASVSAVIRFTWRDPATGRRGRGVFKILKPYIPEYFAEDMGYLQGLAEYFGERHHCYGFPAHLISDTFSKVRRLLHQEVNFLREQKTLQEASAIYQNISGIRIPQVLPFLCTSTITALTEERGTKVTNAALRLPRPARRRIAEQLIEGLLAVPLLSGQDDALFHGDPHAGNLLYDARSGRLTIIDWALQERLSRELRRHLALLFLMLSMRDPVGVTTEVLALSQSHVSKASRRAESVRRIVASFLNELPLSHFATGADTMRLLEKVAVEGIRFPRALVMLSKVIFTLNGILADVAGEVTPMGLSIARCIAQRWITHRNGFRSPLKAQDWVILQCSALLYPTRLWLKYEENLLARYLPTVA
jgi:ubiquinone biosynthesis protein